MNVYEMMKVWQLSVIWNAVTLGDDMFEVFGNSMEVWNTFFASVFLGSGIWVFNMWGSLGSLWGALKHKEHKYWGVEINDLPEQLHSTASSTDGLAAIDSEGKNYYTTFEDFRFEVICCLKLCEKHEWLLSPPPTLCYTL